MCVLCAHTRMRVCAHAYLYLYPYSYLCQERESQFLTPSSHTVYLKQL